MFNHQRRSLEGAFDGINITRARSSSPTKFTDLVSTTLKKSIERSGFPNWRTLRGLSTTDARPCSFTLKMNQSYRELDGYTEENEAIFNRSKAVIEEIQEMLGGDEDEISAKEKLIKRYSEFTVDTMAHLIFGSNEQEKAGMGLDTTINLCRRIFAGEEIDPAKVDPRSTEYQDQIRKLVEDGIETHPGTEYVIRSRREVIQHAQALMLITNAALARDEPLTEYLIKDTHKILCQGLTLQKDEDEDWAGVYRNAFVRAGETNFCDPKMVPHYMKKFVEAFNEDARKSEMDQELDPFFLAADICQDFVTIHPFKDGNGRMCRLIANAYLIKYAGIMISVGEHDEDRKEYLKLAELAGAGETEEEARGKLATFFLAKANATLGRLRAKLMG